MNNTLIETFPLEPSTNTHTLKTEKVIRVTQLMPGSIKVDTLNDKRKIVIHGEHATIAFKRRFLFKSVQRELNPITNIFQNAFD